ncbi:HAMP domain-containing sensor histidine kinase [Paenibacillus sp. 453mf]|uniref:sensor histidine kinase n=1 Tax=Paenibacillus sp. 453mf TaxID=1761874 RepID=UPI0008E5668C|nr:HAMP domain-containing sensor histidine kinase [Paenibacillus sp. 453mf]SFS55786.1 two-component system, OmpR family, sensor kinase [Paenibacillus sp. 453mf]
MMKTITSFIQRVFSPQSLRNQLLIRTLFILSFILVIIGLLQYWVMKDFLYNNEAESLRTKMMSLPHELWSESELLMIVPPFRGLEEEVPAPVRSRFLFLQDISVAVIGQNGAFEDLTGNTGLSSPQLSLEEYTSTMSDLMNPQQMDYRIAHDKNGEEQLLVFRPIGGIPSSTIDRPLYFLQVGTETGTLRDVLFQQLLTFISLSVFALFAGLALYLTVLRKTLVPLSNIVDAVENTNAGNLQQHLPTRQGQEEIDRLSNTFNEMLKRLETSFEHEKKTKEQMGRFIADASHELRTPLTSIHGFLEVLLRGAAERPEQLYNALNSMHGESKRIIKLVEDLLFLAKIDREPGLHLSKTNITNLVREMKSQLRVLGGEREIIYDLTEGIEGEYDADKIKQVILNLFQNAIQHTDPVKGKITIALMVTDKQFVLSIQDNGPGIGAESLPYVFDRFYRVDNSRTRQHGGAGLGLSITQTIVHAHGGTVEVNSHLGEGATFSVYIPMN